jgi:hypothetical protein
MLILAIYDPPRERKEKMVAGAIGYFQPRGWSRLCIVPWHRLQFLTLPYGSFVILLQCRAIAGSVLVPRLTMRLR